MATSGVGGKGIAKKTLIEGRVPHSLGEENASITDAIDEAPEFISKKTTNMSVVCKDVWATNMAKPKLTLEIG